MTLPVIISTAEEGIALRTAGIPYGQHFPGRHPLADHSPHYFEGSPAGYPDRRHPWSGMCPAGETAPILFTGAAFFLPPLLHSPFDATMALPYHLFVISTQVPEMPVQIQYGTALVLLVFVLTMNLIATVIRSRARAKRQW